MLQVRRSWPPLLLAAVVLTGSSIPMGDSVVAPPPPQGASPLRMSAQLYYRDKGTLSHDVLGDSAFRYWNAIIGEGSARGWVSAALVTVSVRVTAPAIGEGDTLRFSARTSTRTLLSRDVLVGAPAEETVVEPFLVYGVGCDTVRLQATVRRNGERARLERILPFRCAE